MIKFKLLLKQETNKLFSTGFFHIFGSDVINKILGFASGIILIRILSKSDYGIYAYANNIYSFFLLVSGFGMASSVLQMGSETADEKIRNAVFSYGCRVGTFFNICLGIVILLVSIFIKLPIKGSNTLLALMFLLPLMDLLPGLQFTYLRTELRNKEYSSVNVISTASKLFFACLLSLLLRAQGLILGYYLADLLLIILLIQKYKVRLPINKPDSLGINKREMLRIGGISTLNNGLSQAMYLMGIFVLGIIIPDKIVIASYKIATIIPTALNFIPASVITYVYPYFARNRFNKKWLLKNYRSIVLSFGIANVLVALLLIIFAPYVIRIVFGAQYLDAVMPFRILCFSYTIAGTFRIISGNLLVTQRKLKANLYLAVLSSVMNTVMSVIMIKAWGSDGAAIATLLTVVITSIISTSYLIYVFKHVEQATESGL